MRSTLLFYLSITAETFTESKFLAYSCEKPCGFFFKFCPVGNLQFDTVSLCSTSTLHCLFKQVQCYV